MFRAQYPEQCMALESIADRIRAPSDPARGASPEFFNPA
jgi:hypothetical protein